MISSLLQGIFCFLILLLPTQFGKHFWFPFSYISGIRVDYLAPTLYLSDIVFILFFAFLIFKHKLIFPSVRISIVLLAFIVIQIIVSREKFATVYGCIKLIECICLSWAVTSYLHKKNLLPVIYCFSFAAIFESLLAIWQFIQQRSIGGIFYFFGERTFTVSSPHIASMTIGDRELLRSYGTFSHPNVLAYYLLFAIVVISWGFVLKRTHRLFLKIALILSIVGLLLTFSRVIILVAVLQWCCIIYTYTIKRRFSQALYIAFISIFIIFSLYLYFYQQRFIDLAFLTRDVGYRLELFKIAFQIFLQHPFWGIGFLNFYFYEINFQHAFSAIFLQPVHSIFMLIAVEAGIVGLLGFIALLVVCFKRIRVRKQYKGSPFQRFMYSSIWSLFVITLIIGMFDHFLITLQQGQLLLALLFGFIFTKKKF